MESLRILIATANPGKVCEFRQMLASDRLQWSDFSSHAPPVPVEETGHTFHENACLKASGYALQFGSWALADDSGLEVDALNGAPGVYSARWAHINGVPPTGGGGGGSSSSADAQNNALLLRQLVDVPDARRTARFVCVLALSDPRGRVMLTAEGAVEGQILRSPRGSNGFGYDPLFLLPDRGLTTAELSPEQKHQVSHRGQALRRLKILMSQAGLA